MSKFPDCCCLQLVLLFLWKTPSRRVLFAVGNLTSVVGRGVTELLRLAETSRDHLVQPAELEAISPLLQPVEVPPSSVSSVNLLKRVSRCLQGFCCGWDLFLPALSKLP